MRISKGKMNKGEALIWLFNCRLQMMGTHRFRISV